jgi:hypothetical protein
MSFFQRFPGMAQILCLPAPPPLVNNPMSSSQTPQVEEALPQFDVHKGTFHRVTVAAIQNLLFMMRVASAYLSFITKSVWPLSVT